MTHDTNCQVLDEYRDEVNRIAQAYQDGEVREAAAMAEDLGWERLGSGIARVAWLVAPEMQDGTVESPTQEAPCVVKFAQGPNGTYQNTEEIYQYENFPAAVKEADPPVVVPVSDHDDRDHTWLSVPEAEPGGMFAGDVQNRLAEVGYYCEDVHGDNVGEMHGAPVLLDYGMDCHEIELPIEIADDIARWVDDDLVDDVETTEIGDGATFSFTTPAWIGLPETPETSTIGISPREGPHKFNIFFGPWDDDQAETLERSFEKVNQELEDLWYVHSRPLFVTNDGKTTVELDIDAEVPSFDERFTADMAAELVEDTIGWVEQFVVEAENPISLADEVMFAITSDDLVRSGTATVDSTAGGASLSFLVPADAPGFEPQHDASEIVFDPAGFVEMHVTLGPWRADEPQAALLPDGADAVIRGMNDRYPDVDWSWRRLRGEPAEKEVIRFSGDRGHDSDDAPTDPDVIAGMYERLLLESVAEMPLGRKGDEPVQEEIDEFVEARLARERVAEDVGAAVARRLSGLDGR